MSKTNSSPALPARRPISGRSRDGRFAAGNPGGPGRPKKSEEANRHFLSTVRRIVEHPDWFSDDQRDALVRLITSLMDGPDHQAIAAASVLVEMEGANIGGDG